ncbi:putative vesicle-associated membrane protein 726 [Physcomitrium patens]|uniref:Uncharacterized protein n=1 Tax=Physcomitrium patens TaxID=3218 RepID=A9TMZ3_PHYPA|nr:putative vesicle-associated membrane protein 726 [Physcomitrium patens]PNR41648.1 hypothetical protein PHYPA_019053 [Physcomitrium patens]|eukprot:XP_024395306.1 putative vesicle-associated membrane protein 726 [Physcomitrella patens]
MGDANLIYSLVSRGTTVLAEYTSFAGNFSQIAMQCLVKLPAANNKHTYVMDRHTFNFLVQDGFTYLVVAEEDFGRQIPFAFLDRVKDDFKHRYQGGKADLAVSHSLDAEFGPRLKEHMDFCERNPEEIRKMSKIKSQVAEVKGIMMENIDKVLVRNEKIDLLVDRTSHLQSDAHNFQRQGKKIRYKLWCQNYRLKLLVLVLIIIVAFIIYLSICRGFVCYNPGVPGTPPAPGTPPGQGL